MPRGYFDAITLFPPPGQSEGGAVTLYAVGEDPNGVLAGDVGDFAWQVGTGIMWSCTGSTTWVQAPSDVPAASRVYFRWQPGGEDSQATGTYVEWADVHAAAVAAVAAGNVVTIVVDDTLSSPATTTAGTYDMTDIELLGVYGLRGGDDTQSVMVTAEDTVFTNWGAGISFLSIGHGGAEALFTVPAETGWNFSMGRRSEILSTAAGPVISVTASSATLTINALHAVGIGNGTNETLLVAGGETVTINAVGTVTIAANALDGAGNVTVTTPSVYSAVSATQPGLGGTLTVNQPDASVIPYTPTTGGDWVDPDPETVQEALDRIASAVEGLLGAPIP